MLAGSGAPRSSFGNHLAHLFLITPLKIAKKREQELQNTQGKKSPQLWGTEIVEKKTLYLVWQPLQRLFLLFLLPYCAPLLSSRCTLSI